MILRVERRRSSLISNSFRLYCCIAIFILVRTGLVSQKNDRMLLSILPDTSTNSRISATPSPPAGAPSQPPSESTPAPAVLTQAPDSSTENPPTPAIKLAIERRAKETESTPAPAVVTQEPESSTKNPTQVIKLSIRRPEKETAYHPPIEDNYQTWEDPEWSSWEETMKSSIQRIEKEVESVSFEIDPIMDMDRFAMERDQGTIHSRRIAKEMVGRNQTMDTPEPSFHEFKIPVLGTTVNGEDPRRFLARFLWSIDETVGAIVITWYGNGKAVQRTLETFVQKNQMVEAPFEPLFRKEVPSQTLLASWNEPSYRRFILSNTTTTSSPPPCTELFIAQYPMNLGCATGFNNPILLIPSAPWWLIVNNDVAFPPGKLTTIGETTRGAIESKKEHPLAVHFFAFIYGRASAKRQTNYWSIFSLTATSVASVGLFDENFFPAYYEDDDYEQRVRRVLGEEALVFDRRPHVSVAHGGYNASTYQSGNLIDMQSNRISRQGIWDHEYWKVLVNVALPEKYYHCKHGRGKYEQPFGKTTESWSDWTLNAARRRCVYEGVADIMSRWDATNLTAEDRRERRYEVAKLSDRCAVCHDRHVIANVVLDS